MNYLLGTLFLYFAWSHMKDAIEPNRMSRNQVRIQSGMLCIFTAFLGILLFIGTGEGT